LGDFKLSLYETKLPKAPHLGGWGVETGEDFKLSLFEAKLQKAPHFYDLNATNYFSSCLYQDWISKS
jgi:hypothetical protein